MRIKALKQFFIRMATLMCLYSVLRLAFLLINQDQYSTHSAGTLFLSHLYGLRFDLAALAWINAVFLFFTLIPAKFEKIERALFLLVNGAFIGGSIADLEIFRFNGKRISMEFYTTLGEDFWQQLGQVLAYYWPLTLLTVFVFVVVWWLDQKISQNLSERKISLKYGIPLLLFLLGSSFVAIRGGLQFKSIHVQSAFIQGENELGHLVLNSPYHFLRTFSTPRAAKIAWFSDVDLKTKLTELHSQSSYPGHKNQNVILIILESFSLEYIEEGYAPFLKELSRKGLLFPKHFANGRRSIEVLSSLFDGVPSVQEVPFSKSNAQGMKLSGVATKLKNAKYSTAFFHGAARGSMGFEAYSLSHGIEKYYSREDYAGEEKDFDGQWGIYDGPYLKFAIKKMSELKKPFFVGVFTLSSHQPYAIPKEFKGKFPKGSLEIHESIGYVDQMLREFFEEAQKQEWYNETLFVLTADHTQKLEKTKFLNSLGQYRVPLILFHPKIQFDKKLAHKVTEHIDLPVTILDFLDVDELGLCAMGESIFSPGEGKALHFLQPGWQYIKGQRVVQWVENKEPQEWIWNAETGERKPVELTNLKTESQYYIQYLFNGFRANKWPFALRE
ncbi:MAG: LTA synthase family protein [Bacteriovoracaceae bacterium]|nr:LTA synthase family protein [Bacteriovoracaceae bacterium]